MRNDQYSILVRPFLKLPFVVRAVRGFPFIGDLLSWISGRVVARGELLWAQVQSGPATNLWLKVNPRTDTTLLQGEYEPEVQDALRTHLRAGMRVYDVGANIGFFSLLVARLLGPQGSVYAFEPDPEAAGRLRMNAERNRFGNIHVLVAAVWSQSRKVIFSRGDPHISPDRGHGHIVAEHGRLTIEVDAVSLDDFAELSGAPHFIKCDVEGAEVEVLSGGRRVLQDRRPGILCGVHTEQIRNVLVSHLTAVGYCCQPCGDRHILALAKSAD